MPLFRRCLTTAVCSHFWEKALIQCTSFFMQLKTFLKKTVERFQNGRWTTYKASLYPQEFYKFCSFISIALKLSVWPNYLCDVATLVWLYYLTGIFLPLYIQIYFHKKMQTHFSYWETGYQGFNNFEVSVSFSSVVNTVWQLFIFLLKAYQAWFQNCKCEASLGRCCSRCCKSSCRALMCLFWSCT